MAAYTRRDTAMRWGAYALVCLALAFVHSMTLGKVRFWGVVPFLPPLLPAVIASVEDRLESAVFALCFGVLCDLALVAPLPCLYTVSFTVAALLASFLAGNVLQPGPLCSLAVSTVAFAVVDVLVGAGMVLTGRGTVAAVAVRAVREAAVSLPLLVVCHPLLMLVHRKFTL